MVCEGAIIEDGSTSVETFLNLYKDHGLGKRELGNRNLENRGYLKAISAII